VPDIVLLTDPLNDSKRTLHVIELRYCSEGERPAMVRTAEQLAALLSTLRAKNEWNVLFHPIILGTTGAVYTDTLQTLMEPGVGTRDGNTLLAQLHTHAVGALQVVYGGNGNTTCRDSAHNQTDQSTKQGSQKGSPEAAQPQK